MVEEVPWNPWNPDYTTFLQNLISRSSFYIFIVPNENFRKNFLNFYHKIPQNLVYTPTSLLRKLSIRPISSTEACLLKNFDFLQDPTTIGTSDETDWQKWQHKNCHYTWHNDLNIHEKLADYCIFFGDFSRCILDKIVENLRKNCQKFFHFKRTFSEIKSTTDLSTLQAYHTTSEATGYAWIESMKQTHPNAICILLPHAYSEIIALFQKPIPREYITWLDWQEQGTLGYFITYLQVIEDDETFHTHYKDLQEAYNACLSNQFPVLYTWLLQNKKDWIRPFQIIDQIIKLPPSETLGVYLKVFHTHLEKLHPPMGNNLSLLTNDAFWFTCPLSLKKSQFFHLLRQWLQLHVGFLDKMLPWPDVAYFPIKDGFIPQCIHARTEYDKDIQAWLYENAYQQNNFHLCYPLKSLNGENLQPLLKINSSFFQINSSQCNFNKSYSIANHLKLPKDRICFSCKKWECFYRYPLKTWLENFLKTTSVLPYYPLEKKKILGEWMHDNLTFDKQPKNLSEWKENIQKRSQVRWQKFGECTNECTNLSGICTLLHQLHQQALFFSYKIAGSCIDFFAGDWKLHSEWNLPKDATYTGRIDLLALDEKNQKLTIVDYKSRLKYSFTSKGVDRGEGLQLLLYGRSLESLYPEFDITLLVIKGNGEKQRLRLKEINHEVQDIETWLQTFLQTGLYEIPEDNPELANTLPLAYPKTQKH